MNTSNLMIPSARIEQRILFLRKTKIMRAFVRLWQMLASNLELARKLNELEEKYDQRFKIVFRSIRLLMGPSPTKVKPIGFRARIKP